MSADSAARPIVHPGLIWGHEHLKGQTRPLQDPDLVRESFADAGFRWIHLNLADLPTRRWIDACSHLPPTVRELLLSADPHPRAVVEDGVLGGVLQDVERDFDDGETRVGATRFAVGPTLMLTARHHPVRSADIVRERIGPAGLADPASALELLLAAVAEAAHRSVIDFDRTVQALEDELLKGGSSPGGGGLLGQRLLMVRIHRMLNGNRAVLHDLTDHMHLAPALAAVVGRASERLTGLDAELSTIQGQLRLLREEIDLQATQRTNQNLYILSIVTALMMPATLVTGIFGMNTGGFPWAMHPLGTVFATSLALGSAVAVYFILRMKGFFRQ